MKAYKCTFCVTDISTFYTDTVNAPFQWIAYIILKFRNKGCTKLGNIIKVKN
jgi:hypothetical protein